MNYTKWLLSFAILLASFMTYAQAPCDVSFIVDGQFRHLDIMVLIMWDNGMVNKVGYHEAGGPLTSTWQVSVPTPSEDKHFMEAFVKGEVNYKVWSLMPFKCSNNKLQLRFPLDFGELGLTR